MLSSSSSSSSSSSLAELPFHVYFALRLAQERGYQPGAPEEAQWLVDAGHVVCTRADGLTFSLLIVVDRAAGPLAADAAQLLALGLALLPHTGSVGGKKLPVGVQIWELGPTSVEDRARLRAVARRPGEEKVGVECFTLHGTEVWTTARFGGRLVGRGSALAIAREPRRPAEELGVRPPAARLPDGPPLASYVLLAALTVIFVGELVFGVAPLGGFLDPHLYTLVAWGGLAHGLVYDGEWFRLLTAAFLHGNFLHLAMNGIALVMAGAALERQVGRLWFLALFVVGGLGGSALSLVLNSPGLVSVGASGAIMGLLAAAFVVTWRLPHGGERTLVQMNMARILVPSLLPLAVAVGGNIDYAGHLGGALAGVAAGWLLLRAWPRDRPVPRGGRLATAIVAAGLAALVFAAVQLGSGFAAIRAEVGAAELAEKLLPDDQLGDSDKLIADSEQLVKKYPRDPRVYFFDALRRGRAEDSAGAIVSLRRGLEEEEVLARVFPDGKLVLEMRALLAALLTDAGERDEASKVLAPSCAAVKADARFEHIRELCP